MGGAKPDSESGSGDQTNCEVVGIITSMSSNFVVRIEVEEILVQSV